MVKKKVVIFFYCTLSSATQAMEVSNECACHTQVVSMASRTDSDVVHRHASMNGPLVAVAAHLNMLLLPLLLHVSVTHAYAHTAWF